MQINCKCILVIAVIILIIPSLSNATIATFDDYSAFITATLATSATGPLPDLGRIPGGAAASSTVGTVTFTITLPSWELYIGTAGAGYGVPDDWTPLLPGPDIAISDIENLNADFNAPVFSAGFFFANPYNDGRLFTVSLLNGSVPVGSFTYAPPPNQALFYGVGSDLAFNRMEIRETVGGVENEYWGQFYTGTTPLRPPAVPLPGAVLLLGAGLGRLLLYRRRKLTTNN